MRFHKGLEDLSRSAPSNVPVSESAIVARRQEMGEYMLVEAVLRAAIYEYQKFAGQRTLRGERLFREVDQWFIEDDRDWDFSFINVCQILDLEPSYIRAGLKMWRDRNTKQNIGIGIADSGTKGMRRSRGKLARLSTSAILG